MLLDPLLLHVCLRRLTYSKASEASGVHNVGAIHMQVGIEVQLKSIRCPACAATHAVVACHLLSSS